MNADSAHVPADLMAAVTDAMIGIPQVSRVYFEGKVNNALFRERYDFGVVLDVTLDEYNLNYDGLGERIGISEKEIMFRFCTEIRLNPLFEPVTRVHGQVIYQRA